jgi:YegS/Rv2252/BmrU family lipid kinase
MRGKNASLIVNPRAGENVAKLPHVVAVLAAAGWRADIEMKLYGGHTLELATEAARQKHDLVVAYGGDGTLNQVVNGVMNAKGHRSSVGVIPGGTANVWANEIGLSSDAVKAVLTLINSQARKVDIGHVEVESLTFPTASGSNLSDAYVDMGAPAKNKRKVKATSRARNHFLLMAGLGIDAAVMSHVPKPLKYRIGPLAVGVSAVQELPKQHPFPVEIRSAGEGGNGAVLWKGEAIQIVIGNTRKYADIVEMTPDAYIDDGILDVCVITAGDPLTTLQQITSLLLRRKPDNMTAEYFHGAHLTISVPASVAMHLDGSAVKLKDYLSKLNRKALQEAGDTEKVMVNYRFDAMPRALDVAIPCTYNDALFEHTEGPGKSHTPTEQSEEQQKAQEQAEQDSAQQDGKSGEEGQGEVPELVTHLMQQGRKVTVVGASPNPDKKQPMYIVAGSTSKKSTGESKPVAVRIDKQTQVLHHSGESASLSAIEGLKEGAEIIVEGKQSKLGVISAKRVVI